MTAIAQLFDASVMIIDRMHPNGKRELGYLVRTAKYTSNYAMISYLLQYPLFTYKYACPPVYARILQLGNTKEHKIFDGNTMLLELKDLSMNNTMYTQQEHIRKMFYKH